LEGRRNDNTKKKGHETGEAQTKKYSLFRDKCTSAVTQISRGMGETKPTEWGKGSGEKLQRKKGHHRPSNKRPAMGDEKKENDPTPKQGGTAPTHLSTFTWKECQEKKQPGPNRQSEVVVGTGGKTRVKHRDGFKLHRRTGPLGEK